MGETSLEEVRSWLEQGREDPDKLVDLPWTVVEELRKDGVVYGYRMAHPKVPVRLLVMDFERIGNAKIIRIVVETGIPTIDMGREEKLKLYRVLLDLNKLPYTKIYIFGDDHEIGVAADMAKRDLSKDEFEEYLASVLGMVVLLSKSKELARYIEKEEFRVLNELVRTWYREGVPQEEALARLVRAGLSRELAEKFIRTVYQDQDDYVTLYI